MYSLGALVRCKACCPIENLLEPNLQTIVFGNSYNKIDIWEIQVLWKLKVLSSEWPIRLSGMDSSPNYYNIYIQYTSSVVIVHGRRRFPTIKRSVCSVADLCRKKFDKICSPHSQIHTRLQLLIKFKFVKLSNNTMRLRRKSMRNP